MRPFTDPADLAGAPAQELRPAAALSGIRHCVITGSRSDPWRLTLSCSVCAYRGCAPRGEVTPEPKSAHTRRLRRHVRAGEDKCIPRHGRAMAMNAFGTVGGDDIRASVRASGTGPDRRADSREPRRRTAIQATRNTRFDRSQVGAQTREQSRLRAVDSRIDSSFFYVPLRCVSRRENSELSHSGSVDFATLTPSRRPTTASLAGPD